MGMRPELGLSKSGAGRGAQAALTILAQGFCVCSRERRVGGRKRDPLGSDPGDAQRIGCITTRP